MAPQPIAVTRTSDDIDGADMQHLLYLRFRVIEDRNPEFEETATDIPPVVLLVDKHWDGEDD